MSEKTNDPQETPRVSGSSRDDVVTRWKSATGAALEELRRLIRSSRFSQRAVEVRAGFSKGYLSQLFARNLDLKVWHVLAILDALELNPGEFFFKVYPATRYRALESFRRSSQPLSPDMDEMLGRLYHHGVESLNEIRDRLNRCEQAVSKLEEKGYLDGRSGRRAEES